MQVQMGKEKGFNNKWFDCTTWSKRASEVPEAFSY